MWLTPALACDYATLGFRDVISMTHHVDGS
jgi:hypothetical protein